MIRNAIQHALRPGCFFVAPPRKLRIEHVADEETRWEVFRGHLLAPAVTRQEARFESWHIFLDEPGAPSPAPLVSLRWQHAAGQLHITRQILTHGFAAYESSPGVILSREEEQWIPELVGTLEIDLLPPDRLAAELSNYLLLSVIGVSRLPITSLESPLPAFSLGHLGYLPENSERSTPWSNALEMFASVLAAQPCLLHQAKALEMALRTSEATQLPELAEILARFVERADLQDLRRLFRELFNNVALSPYTAFADRLVALLLSLAHAPDVGPSTVLDMIAAMSNDLCRHLTAFDLMLFHNLGANYPDALFLDSLLKATLQLIDEHPDLALSSTSDSERDTNLKRRRRLALRQACLQRRQYEGHKVPDRPTSIGENQRVLPAPYARVDDEQITQANKRQRRLFADEPLESLLSATARQCLSESIDALQDPAELAELGIAWFLDRPCGAAKEPGDVDRTPLISYQATSRSIIRRRLSLLKSFGWLSREKYDSLTADAKTLPIHGLPVNKLELRQRPGVVSLGDAYAAAPDFTLNRASRRSLDALLAHYDWQPLRLQFPATADWLLSDSAIILVPQASSSTISPAAMLRFHDQEERLRLELAFDRDARDGIAWREQSGQELPTRLRVAAVWEAQADGQLVRRETATDEVWIELRVD